MLRKAAIIGLVFLFSAGGCSNDVDASHKMVALFGQGNYFEAISMCRELLAEDKNDVQAHHYLIKSYQETGRIDLILNEYTRLAEREPENAAYQLGLGYAYTLKSDFSNAIELLEKALALDRNIEFAHSVLGWIYFYGDPEIIDHVKGEKHWRTEIDNHPGSVGAMHAASNLGEYYLGKGMYEEAEMAWNHFLEHAFTQGDIEVVRQRLENLREIQRQETSLLTAIKNDPDDGLSILGLASIHYQTGRLDEAIHGWKRATELQPDNAQAYNFLGRAYYTKNMYDEAKEAFEKAISLNKDFGLAYFNLARVYELQGKLEDARREYHKFVEVAPYDPEAEKVKVWLKVFERALEESQEAEQQSTEVEPGGKVTP